MGVSNSNPMPTKTKIVQHWQVWLYENGFDLGEPTCWACRKWWSNKYDLQPLENSSISRGWEKSPLQRCHILAKQLGGSNTADNLFLMCRECHDLAPNTPYRDVFFKWVSKQDWVKRRINRLKEEMEVYSFTVEDSERISNILSSTDFKKWAEDKIGLHGSQRGYGIGVTFSSVIGLAHHYDLMNRKESK